MLIPVRCFTCSKVIGHLWDKYCELVSEKSESGDTEMKIRSDVLDELGITEYCCRRMLTSHVNIIDTLLLYDSGKK